MAGAADWRFLRVQELMAAPPQPQAGAPPPPDPGDFLKTLELAGQLLFKGPKLMTTARWLQWILGAVLLAVAALPVLLVLVALAVLLWQVWFVRVLFGLYLLAAIVLAIFFARGGLRRVTQYFDHLYLDKGSLKNLLRAQLRAGAESAAIISIPPNPSKP